MKKNFLIISFLLLIFKTEAQTSVLNIVDSIMQTGDYQLALAELQSVKKPPFEVLEKIASIHQKVSNHSKAIEFYQKAFVMKPSDKVKEQLGKSYQLIGNADKAIELFNEVLEKNPNNLLLKYALAKLYISERKVKKGIELLEELSIKDSLNPNYQYQLGVAYQKIGRDGILKSGTSFLEAYKIDSTHLKSIYNLAKFYRKLKFKDSTTLFINRGLQINPKSINFNQLKAKDAFYNKKFDTALVYLKKLEDLNFKTKFTYKLYGLVYLNMKNYEDAKISLMKAQRIDFKDSSISYNLGLAYEGVKDFKSAEFHFIMSIMNQKPDVDHNYYKLGMTQLARKLPKRAIKSFEKGIENNHRNNDLLYHLALVSDSYYKDKKIALKHYEKYIEKFEDKDNEQMAFAKRRIKEIKKALFIKGETVD